MKNLESYCSLMDTVSRVKVITNEWLFLSRFESFVIEFYSYSYKDKDKVLEHAFSITSFVR